MQGPVLSPPFLTGEEPRPVSAAFSQVSLTILRRWAIPTRGKACRKTAGLKPPFHASPSWRPAPLRPFWMGPPEASRRYLTHLPAADTVSRDASLLHIGTGHDDCA